MAKMSEFEKKVLNQLEALFPNVKIEHNKSIGKGYKVDFVVHGSMDIAIECHGKQHFEYVSLYHKNDEGWLDQMKRDEEKLIKVMDSGMPFVEVYYDDPITKDYLWRRINDAIELQSAHLSPYIGRTAQYETSIDLRKTKRESYYFLARREKELAKTEEANV